MKIKSYNKSFHNKMSKTNKLKQLILNNILLICIFISIIVGFAVGFGLRLVDWKNNENTTIFPDENKNKSFKIITNKRRPSSNY